MFQYLTEQIPIIKIWICINIRSTIAIGLRELTIVVKEILETAKNSQERHSEG